MREHGDEGGGGRRGVAQGGDGGGHQRPVGATKGAPVPSFKGEMELVTVKEWCGRE